MSLTSLNFHPLTLLTLCFPDLSFFFGILAGFASMASNPLHGQTLVLAVGMEKVVPAYTGALIRIERPSDNTQQDIGFVSGGTALNMAAVTAFLGTSQGWITELYDQSGNGRNVLAPVNTSGTGAATDNMPTISTAAPTAMTVNGSSNLTGRNVEQGFGPGTTGNVRYFILPSSVSVNKNQASVGKACRADEKKLCADIKPGAMGACMKSHAADLSKDCKEALAKSSAK